MRDDGKSGDGKAPGRACGRNLFLLQSSLPREVRRKPGRVSQTCAGTRAHAGRRDLHLSDASGGSPGRSRLMPEMRHGARAGRRARGHGRGAQPRTHRHDATFLDRPRSEHSGRRARDGRPPHELAYGPGSSAQQLAAARARDAGGLVVRLAVLRPRMAVAGQPQSEHVHADRDGNRHRLGLQHRRHPRARHLSGSLSQRRRGRGLF